MIKRVGIRKFPSGYWPGAMNEADKSGAMLAFKTAIYPLWAAIEKKDLDADRQMTPAQANASRVLSECLTLHKQDRAIYESGIKPAMNTLTPADAANFRRKAAASDKFTKWQESH